MTEEINVDEAMMKLWIHVNTLKRPREKWVAITRTDTIDALGIAEEMRK